MRKRRRARPCEFGCVLLGMLSGCSAPADTATPTAPFTLLETRAGDTVVTAEMIYPLEAVDREFEVVQPSDAEPVVRRRRITDRFGASWSDVEEGVRERFLAHDEHGNLVMTAVIDERNRAVTRFNPPLIIAYRELHPGESRTEQVAMRVYDLRNRRRLRESGTATQSITYVGDQRVRTPLGEFMTARVEIEFVADLRLADAHHRQTLYVAPGFGPVLEEESEKVLVLGVLPRRSGRVMVLKKATRAFSSAP